MKVEVKVPSRPITVYDLGGTVEQVDARKGQVFPKGDNETLYSTVVAFSTNSTWQRAVRASA